MAQVDRAHVDALRAFNRSYTAVMGFLDQGLLHSRFSLTEARVIFELAQRHVTEVRSLRQALGVDAGQLSRTLAKLEDAGLIERARSESDGRLLQATLSDSGRDAFTDLDRRSSDQASSLLSRLTDDDQARLVAALATVRDVLDPGDASPVYVIRPPRPGDLGWVVQSNGALYAREYGWDETYEALVARIVSDYGREHDPKRENAWIAERDGRPVGAVFCMRKDDTTAQLRLLLVEPSARGSGLGTRLVDECLAFARAAGYESIMLWTNDVLAAARRIYQKAGFELVEEQAHHSFGHDLVGQIWERDLR